MRRSGSADLPLHNGHVPKWLADRMTRLGAVLTEAIVHHYGRDEFLRRVAHPFWFQSFGALMGMDWHSSGITTSVLGALKRGLNSLSGELGLHVCGGRGKHSRLTPRELVALGDRIGFDGDALAKASRLTAKVDSAAVQDGFDLYLHGFVVSDEGRWAVVQQGMNGDRKQARRYHWLSEGMTSFVEEPHKAIEGQSQGDIVNLTDRRAEQSRRKQIELLGSVGPDRIAREAAALAPSRETASPKPSDDEQPAQATLPYLVLPAHHDVRASDVHLRRLHGNLAAAAERGPTDFPDLLLTPGVGARLSARSHWWRKCCTAHLAASAIPRDFRSLTAARIGIRSRFPSKFTMRRFACSGPPSIELSSAKTTHCSLCGSSMRNRGASSVSLTGPHSTTSSPTNSCGHMNMAAAAFSAGSCPRRVVGSDPASGESENAYYF
jgi:hypothetical protein